MSNLHDLALAFRQAETEYNTAFRQYLSDELSDLPDDRFWQLQPALRQEVLRFRFSHARTNGVEQAAREFFRKPLAGDFSGVEYTMEDAIRFAKTWRSVSRRLYEPLFDVVKDRGDDAYGDLLDAVPLAGREVVEKSIRREFGNHEQFDAAVLNGCDGDQRPCELILRGENYVGMSLADAAREYFAFSVTESPQPNN